MKTGKRIVIMYAVVTVMFVFCIARLFVIFNSDTARTVLSGQYTRKLKITERRGFVYDRYGQPMNLSEDGYICFIDASECDEKKLCASELAEISGHTESEITEKMRNGVPFTIRINQEYNRNGVISYPIYKDNNSIAKHILGYTNANGGVSGIQYGFDGHLSEYLGGAVYYRYSSDVNGVPLKEGKCLYDNGYTTENGIFLTIDSELQKECEKLALENISSGAVCITDISSGGILASVSMPDYDPGDIGRYLSSDKGELINRCASSFTPGSVFKTVIAAAALRKNPELYDLEYECTGSITLSDGTSISCHNKYGHGVVDMKKAYGQSCNPYFINLAFVMGADAVLETAEEMGLGKLRSLYGVCSYGKELPTSPDEGQSDEGFLANLAIGQGKVLLSPYEAAALYGCAASGFYIEPNIVKRIVFDKGSERNLHPEYIRVLPDEVTEKLRIMMEYCVTEGLGKNAKPENGNAGGKTATAQTGISKEGKELCNYWFCGVYPINAPRYSIAVLADSKADRNNTKEVFRAICDYLDRMLILNDPISRT